MSGFFEGKLYYDTEPPAGTDISALDNLTIYFRALNPYSQMDAETFKTPKQQFSNTLISYETYKIDIEPFSFSENGSWDITDYDGLISILRANKFLAIVTDFTVTNGKAYPLKWAADDGSFRQFTIKSLTTEEQDGYIHLTIEALSTDFTII